MVIESPSEANRHIVITSALDIGRPSQDSDQTCYAPHGDEYHHQSLYATFLTRKVLVVSSLGVECCRNIWAARAAPQVARKGAGTLL
jgi:hypothetical protein